MHVLLLDTHATPIVSLSSTQSTLPSHQVYLTDRVYNQKRDRMPHMKCICLLQPSEDSLEALEAELREPKYGEYYLCHNILNQVAIERFADMDEYKAVREEHFADYSPLLPAPFSLNHTRSSSRPLYGSTHNLWDPKALEPTVRGITAVLLSLKKQPKLGVEIQVSMSFRKMLIAMLRLLQHHMLSQGTYQAMNGRVDLSLEITVTLATDPFFAAHYLATFGDLGTSLKPYVQSHQSRSLAQSPSSINSISDMKRFVEGYPEFRKIGGNGSKHLLEAASGERGVHAVLTDPTVPAWGKLRIVTLYALQYQKPQTTNIASLMKLMLENGVSREDARLVYVVLNMAGSDQREDDLFSTESLLAKGRSALKGLLKGVENVYTQHTPHLTQTLENLFRLGRLKDTSYHFLEGAGPNASVQRHVTSGQDVIVFMIGGTTYEEARTITLLNKETGGSSARIRHLFGTCVHNSYIFLETIRSAATNFPAAVYEPPSESASTAPVLNLNLGGVNVSLGGSAWQTIRCKVLLKIHFEHQSLKMRLQRHSPTRAGAQ
ncbi:Sec1-like protein [Athelia psychrophila]|uniref:Sec1-like protein n=1 Tax=Athelia psychrophila TaxID=1759441 RepID=A0A167VPN1_9AGAM|nr:Sec1-like protein [Fibularhizoctonia sp. CBS 109695]